MKVICDSHIPFLKGVLEPYCEVVYVPGRDISPATVKDAAAGKGYLSIMEQNLEVLKEAQAEFHSP